ncbi:MAG: BatA domain-containing protein [Deltaproteobacteria bacterium]|nr:BatA domain-containing protein [Deltaproteobacteria bacterium]
MMDFSFLSPLAFRLLYALPLLIVPYLLRERGRRVVVPALFLYQGLPSSARRRLWGRLQLRPLFFLQLLILLLLVVAAAQPFLQRQGGKVALVLDTSASMQARAPSGEGSLFDAAKKQAAQALETIPTSDTISLFTIAPLPAPASAPADDRTHIQQDLARVAGTDAPDPSDDVVSAFFVQLLNERGFQRVFFFTDRPLAAPVGTDALTVVTLGGPQANLGITAFRLYRSPFAPDEVDATVVVEGTDGLTGWNVGIENADTGKLLVSRSFTKGEPLTFSFPHLPLATTYRARLFVEDGLAVDNEAYAVLPALTNVPVLLVTPSPEAARSLGQIPNLKLQRVAPQDYNPARAGEFALVLFHLTAPDTLPSTNAAFILPPEGNTLFPLGKAASRAEVTQWVTGHPLTSYVTFSLLSPPYAQALLPVSWCKPVISATVGPLVLAGERDGKRYVAVGFDLFPYLGTKNLPASILTLNLLGWLADQAGQPPSLKTGASLALQGESASVRLPNGETLVPVGGTVSLNKQGVYTVSENGAERRVAVNLTNAEESRLGRPLHLAPLTSPVPVAPETSGQPLWPWLLMVALFLLGLEWWFAVRWAQVPSPLVGEGQGEGA